MGAWSGCSYSKMREMTKTIVVLTSPIQKKRTSDEILDWAEANDHFAQYTGIEAIEEHLKAY